MNQSLFEETWHNRWLQFEELLEELEKKSGRKAAGAVDPFEFPSRYRELCNHYGLAMARHYSPALVERLHGLVLRGHRLLYRQKADGMLWTALSFLGRDFPRTVRREARVFWLAFALFYLPAVLVGLAAYHHPATIYSVMDEGQVAAMEAMYHPDKKKIGRAEGREAETSFAMFGYYIRNNISIGFRTFAGGIVFGIGTVLLLLFNGLTIGAVAGYLSHPPYGTPFWQFVSGHGAFELTAIVISGAAGLLLGAALIRPGPYRRGDALRLAAPVAIRLTIGAALMLVVAAFIEAFWSPVGFTSQVKLMVAAVNWLLVGGYLLLAGRGAK